EKDRLVDDDAADGPFAETGDHLEKRSLARSRRAQHRRHLSTEGHGDLEREGRARRRRLLREPKAEVDHAAQDLSRRRDKSSLDATAASAMNDVRATSRSASASRPDCA